MLKLIEIVFSIRMYSSTKLLFFVFQVFANMQTLPKYIDELVDIFISDIKHSIKDCFAGIEPKKTVERKSKAGNNVEQSKPKPSPGKPQGTTASQQFARKFWTALENVFDEEIFNCWKQINFLTKCLKKVVYQPNATHRFENLDIEKNFHDRLNELLRISFTDCASHIKQCLVQDLPRLLRMSKQLHVKCESRLNIGYVRFNCKPNSKINFSFHFFSAVIVCLVYWKLDIWSNVQTI